jgi:hypothetical protein
MDNGSEKRGQRNQKQEMRERGGVTNFFFFRVSIALSFVFAILVFFSGAIAIYNKRSEAPSVLTCISNQGSMYCTTSIHFDSRTFETGYHHDMDMRDCQAHWLESNWNRKTNQSKSCLVHRAVLDRNQLITIRYALANRPID